jgi:hypothetical protein
MDNVVPYQEKAHQRKHFVHDALPQQIKQFIDIGGRIEYT